MQVLDRKFTKTYNLPAAQASFKYTVMVRHKGIVIAFAMDDQQHIYYSVLDLEREDIKSTLDSQYWNDKPQELKFPAELVQVGFSVVGVQKMPTVRKNGVTETIALDDKEKDLFLSTTARLTADEPFQVLSDDKHVYVFRQAIGLDHPNNIKLNETIAVVDRTLLCDRFVLVGGELKPKFEIRYQRSRNKDLPADRKDSLGYEDLEKKPFYEPTQEVAFVRNLIDGRFSVVLLPTSLPDVQCWQIFAYNSATQRMDSFNVARSHDGLFNTRGTRYYTSPEPKYQSSVFERESGNCPFTGSPLIEVVSQSGFAESALALNGVDEYVTVPRIHDPNRAIADNFSLEVWVKADAAQESTENVQSIVDGKDAGLFPFALRYLADSGQVLALRSDGQNTLMITSNVSINDATFHHVALVKQDSTLSLYIDGKDVGSTTDRMQPITQDGRPLYFGCLGGKKTTAFFKGQLDEVRLWRTARSQPTLQAEMHHRLIGNEINLIGYWRFDEGAGTRVFDQTDSANHAQFYTSNPAKGRYWVKSEAPVGEHPGVRRSSFAINGRQIVSGCTALMYYQQEQAETGYNPTEKKPIKRNARVMLAVPTAPEGHNDSAKNTIAILDFAVSRDGGLVQVPDQLPLTTIDQAAIGDRSISEILDTISQLEQAEQEFTSSIKEKNRQIQALQQKLATFPICDATLVANSTRDGIHFFSGNKTAKSTAPSTIQTIADSQWRGLPADWVATGIDAIVAWGTEGLKCYIFKGNQCLYYDAMSFRPVSGFEQPRLIKDVFTLPANSPVDWSSGIDAAIRYNPYSAYFFKGDQCLLFNGLVGTENDQDLTRTATTGSIPIKQDFPDIPAALRDLDAVYMKEDSSVLFFKGDKYASSRRNVNSGVSPIYRGYTSLIQEGLRPLVTFYETMRSSLQESINQFKEQISIAEANLKQIQPMLGEQRKLLQNINGDVRLKMPLLHIDPAGLTLSGALLGFAWSDRPPLLFESVNGRVSLYFRGQNSQFVVAYYDVLAQRSQYTLEAKTASGNRSLVKLIARSTAQGTSVIELYDADNSDFCAVRITNSETGMVETWKRVPRQVQAFADVLNGAAGTPGYEAPYDYAANARTNKLTHTLEAGSLFFRVNSADASGHIAAIAGKQTAIQDPSTDTKTTVNCWFSDWQDSALSFSEGTPALSANSAKIPQYAFDDDLTLEAWVNHGAFSAGTARILNYNSGDPATSYALGLFRDPANTISEEQYGVFVGVGDCWLKTAPVPSVQQWRHIAAVFQQSYALKFRGADDVVNCGNDITLDIPEDLTIEAFVRLDSPLTKPQAILTKGRIDDGTDQDCAYSLYINLMGELVFAFEDKDHGNQFISGGIGFVGSGYSYRIAVTRTYKTELKPTQDGQTEVKPSFDFKFYAAREGGTLHSSSETHVGSIASNKQPLEIGQAVARVGLVGDQVEPCHINGEISEVRLWNRALTADEVCRNINGDEKGLVSWWQFEENQGTRAYDSKGNNHGTIANTTWTKSRDPQSSRLMVYINGESVLTTPWTQNKPTYGQVPQFAIGEQSRFQGQLDDIRIWNTARTEEQIQDNLFRRVNGDFEYLLAYYNRNAEQNNVLPDRSGNQLDLTLPPSSNYFVLSTAPIGSETAQVRSVFAQVQTPFHTTIDTAPTVQEYGDMQSDSSGMAIGVWKRCYAYIKDGKWHLITGYKVSDLELEWVGQAQYEPQLVGFIEGAPPVPSENLTIRDANQGEIYENVSAVELIEADRVTYTYAASKENGLDTALKFKVGVGTKSKTLAGIGLASSIEDITVQVGVQGNIDISRGWLNEQRVGFAKGTTRLSRLTTQGNWEDPQAIQYEDLGRRFIPKNVGFALVKSKTADIFALRLKHRDPEKRVTIALSMRPNPDIPEDWNIITFPINPYYTKQGTLDGRIGISPDKKDYPTATDYSSDRSYFKPKEAYALKHRIEREQQQLAAGSLNYSTDPIKGIKNQEEMSKRLPTATHMNLFNTYVWTADGGLFAETQNTMNSKQEVIGGSFSVSGMAGMFMTADMTIGKATVAFELEALMGGHLNLISQRSQDSETGFEVNVSLDVERDIMKREYDVNNNPVKCPGKVDGYRFMTFYLQPDIEHFKDFENKVVDRTWLESSEPNARALKHAISKTSGTPWRVMHRVTYVSRVLPEVGQVMTKTEEALRAANIESNWELIKTLEPFVKAKSKSYPELKQAVEQAIDQYLPELSSPTAKADIVNYMSLYYQVF